MKPQKTKYFYAFWCCYVNKNTNQIFFVLDRMTFILKTAQRTTLIRTTRGSFIPNILWTLSKREKMTPYIIHHNYFFITMNKTYTNYV